MKDFIEVECYGVLRGIAGTDTLQVAVSKQPMTVADVLSSLAEQVPAIRAYLAQTACAIGDTIVKRDALVDTGDTLVLLPPVSGG